MHQQCIICVHDYLSLTVRYQLRQAEAAPYSQASGVPNSGVDNDVSRFDVSRGDCLD